MQIIPFFTFFAIEIVKLTLFFCCFLTYFAPLTTSKVLSLEKAKLKHVLFCFLLAYSCSFDYVEGTFARETKIKTRFILFSARLFVPLSREIGKLVP